LVVLGPLPHGAVRPPTIFSSDVSAVFSWVFAAACACLAAALAALALVEEHPLGGPASARPVVPCEQPPLAAE